MAGRGKISLGTVSRYIATCSTFMMRWLSKFKKRRRHGMDYSQIICSSFFDSFPAALGLASDFWRVAVVGAVAAKLGEEEVAVFNTSYRIMWIVLIMVSALSSAAGIKTSMRLGRLDHHGAKQAGEVGIIMAALVLAVVGFLIVWKIRWFGLIFTSDERFLELFEQAPKTICMKTRSFCSAFLFNGWKFHYHLSNLLKI